MKLESWQKKELKHLTTKIGSGATPTGGKEAYHDEGLSLIRSLNVHDFNFIEKDLAFINETQAKKLNNVEVLENDVLLNITGASVARCCLVPKRILPARVNQHVSIIRANDKVLNPLFLHYILVSPKYKQRLLSISQGGATREALTKEFIESFQIEYPRIETQRKIAGTLSAYDDLIENNNKRIKILEEMAQKLYKEWFVDFKFPNYQNTKFIESELGTIPEGWSVGKIGDINSIKNGYAFKSQDLKDSGDISVIKIKNIQSGIIDVKDTSYITKDIAKKADRFELFKGDILIAMTGAQVGKVGVMPKTKKRFFLNQRVGKFILNKDYIKNNQFLLQFLKSDIFQLHINNTAQGAAQPNISSSQIENIRLLIPNKELLVSYENYVDANSKEVEILIAKNENMSETRDLLLPRLISGELSVEDLEVEI